MDLRVKPVVVAIALAACTASDPVLGDGDFGPLEKTWTATWAHRSVVGWDIELRMYAWETDAHCSDAASWGSGALTVSLGDAALGAPGTIPVIAGPLASGTAAATVTSSYGTYTSGSVTVTAIDPIDATFTLGTSPPGHVLRAPRCE